MSAATLGAQLTDGLRELHLPAVRECFEEEARRARAESAAYEAYLLELVNREREARRSNRVKRLLLESHLPLEKTLASFELQRLPRGVAAQVQVLVEGSFLERHENVLVFGTPGAGKSHLQCAIAQELVQRGYRAYFTGCEALVQELLVAKRDLRLARVLKRFRRYVPLVIDDIGYVQQNREEMEVLFSLLADRYERASVMLTSNLPFSQWEKIFKDPMTTAAAIDRVVHHSVILELNLPSYRLEKSTAKGVRDGLGSGGDKSHPPREESILDDSTKPVSGETSDSPTDRGSRSKSVARFTARKGRRKNAGQKAI